MIDHKMDLTLPIEIRQYFRKEPCLIIDNDGLTYRDKQEKQVVQVRWSEIREIVLEKFSSNDLYTHYLIIRVVDPGNYKVKRPRYIEKYWWEDKRVTEDSLLFIPTESLSVYKEDLLEICQTMWEIHKND